MTDLILLARVGDQRVAFDAKAVDAVVDIDAVIPVPMAPDSVRGLAAIRSRVVESGAFYLVQTRLPGGVHLRTALMNSLTRASDLEALIEVIRSAAKALA